MRRTITPPAARAVMVRVLAADPSLTSPADIWCVCIYLLLDSEVGGKQTAKVTGAAEWTCVACETVNEARSRSCGSCGERKPPANLSHSTADRGRARGATRSGSKRSAPPQRGGRRKHRRTDSDDEDEDGSDEEEVRPRSSSRSRRAVSYAENSDEDEADFGGERGSMTLCVLIGELTTGFS